MEGRNCSMYGLKVDVTELLLSKNLWGSIYVVLDV